MWWHRHRYHGPLNCRLYARQARAEYRRSVAELKASLSISDEQQAQRHARGQHPLGVPGRHKVLPWTMIIVGVLLWGVGLVTIPLGFALWLVAFLLVGEGMVIRERRIKHADEYYERSAAYEQRQVIDHWS